MSLTSLIYGVPEEAEKDADSMIAFVESLLKEGLGLDGGAELQIESASGSGTAAAGERRSRHAQYW